MPKRVLQFLTLITLFAAPRAPAAQAPSVDEMLAVMKINAAEKADILAGKVVSKEIGEGASNELAIGIVMFVRAPLEKLVEAVKSEKLLGKDPEIVAYLELQGDRPFLVKNLPKMYGSQDSDEVDNLFDVEAGDRFNLETSEIASFNSMKGDLRNPNNASGRYFGVLALRFDAYRKKGLAGVAPYDRGGGDFAKPGDELASAARESKLLARYFPVLQKALLEYPASQPPEMQHRFFWINQKVEERPTFILSHRMKLIRPEGAFLAERQYYVGHSYNSMQILAGCIPLEGGTLVFYSNRTFTDQVAGFASGLKHSIGRKQMTAEIIKGFDEIRKSAIP